MATRVGRRVERAQRQRPAKKRPGAAPRTSRRMYYLFIVVSILVALTMIIPTCNSVVTPPARSAPASAVAL